MSKIPVAQTVADSYRFTFGGLGRVIALIWLPIATMTIGGYFVMQSYNVGMAGSLESGDAAQQGPLLLRMFAFQMVNAVLLAVMAVAIVREILAPLKRPVFLRFSLGPAEFRVVGGFIGLYMLMILFIVILTFGGLILGFAGSAIGGAATKQGAFAIAGLVFVFGIFAMIYVFARLGFVMVPAAALEGGFGIERSWWLTKGNFWRIVLVTAATVIPIAIVWAVVQVTIVGADVFNPHLELLRDPAAMMRHQSVQMRQLSAHLPLMMGLQFLLAPFMYGLMFSPAAFAYRALNSEPKKLMA